MIHDTDTNFLYLSDCLFKHQPVFYTRFIKVLQELKIPYGLLPCTKDIWAKDFMPVQITASEYTQFTFDPDYLKPVEFHHLHTGPKNVCNAINLHPQLSNIVLDGGNVIRSANKVIVCDKIFVENPHMKESVLIDELSLIFKTDKIILIPWDQNDFTGHADGMVRFIDDDTVLINQPTKDNTRFEKLFKSSLRRAGLNIVEIPYNPPNDPSLISAKGLHLNFLQMNQGVIVPVFNQETDDRAVSLLENIFKGKSITKIDCNEIAAEGGVLNCISWNVLI